ncbi:MAG: hypothetical protein H7A05_10880 [Pseudomonadales bacterium]|nr:hypothetical protein [Pseudomonadales bacterium]
MTLLFARDKALDPRVTFTRASSGTYFDASGVMQTASTDVARFTHDPVTGQSLGLLIEESRTNLLLNSETLGTQSVTVSATAYTLSFYGTGTITLSGVSSAGPLVGTGANNKVSLTFTPSAGSLTVTVSGSVKYANLEAGSFATSWIPTTGSSATRAADNASITGANFSSWYNQAEGTIVIDYENGLAGYIVLAAGSDTSNAIRLGTRLAGSSDEVLVVIDGGAGQVSLGNSPSTQRNICAASYKENDFALSMNGAAASTTSFGTVPTADTLAIGGTPFYVAFNGTIASIAYYPTRLSNSYLQYLTS